MGTTLSFHGVDAVLDLDDHAITLRRGAAAAPPAGDEASVAESAADAPVVIPRWEVEKVTLKPASLLSYGKLVIATKAGREHSLQFTRDAQEQFADLAAIIG